MGAVPMRKIELIGSLALVGLLAVIIVAYTILYDPEAPLTPDPEPIPDSTPSKTTVTALLRSYEKDATRADRAFKGKIWEISGTISRIEENWLGQPVLRLKGDDPQAGEVGFICRKGEEDRVAYLKSGDEITLRGIGQGRSPRYGVRFKSCIIVF